MCAHVFVVSVHVRVCGVYARYMSIRLRAYIYVWVCVYVRVCEYVYVHMDLYVHVRVYVK